MFQIEAYPQSPYWLAYVQDSADGLGVGNAHLMAAAPEMMEALKKAETFVEEELRVRQQSFLPEGSPYIDEAQVVLDLIGVAISKATAKS